MWQTAPPRMPIPPPECRGTGVRLKAAGQHFN
jgi:hypothetical protein